MTTVKERDSLCDTLDYLAGHFNVNVINRYTDMDVTGFAISLNKGNTLVHGDFHPMNVLVRNGELVLIDTGDAYFRYGFLDHMTLYTVLVVQSDTEEKAMNTAKMSSENAHRLWDAFVECYFSPKTAEEKERINSLLSRMSKVRIAMAVASMNGMDEPTKTTIIGKLLGSIGTDVDGLKREIDEFEAMYENQ